MEDFPSGNQLLKQIDLPMRKCEFCGKEFLRPSALKTHTYVHTGERPYPCTVLDCKSKFTSLSNLRRHVKALHTLQNHNSVSNMATKKENKMRIPALPNYQIPFALSAAREYTFIDESTGTNSHKFPPSVTHKQTQYTLTQKRESNEKTASGC